LKNTHLLRYAHPSSLRRTQKYASFLVISRALHPNVFKQPVKYFNNPLIHRVKGECAMAYFITDNCLICGTCWEICPTDSIEEYEWYYRITDTCVECGACARVCPNAAIIKVAPEKNSKKKKSA